jgi:hypothetical protein
MAVQVTMSDLTEKVNAGWKRDALAEHYRLPKSQMSDLLRQAGLKIRKFHAPKFELVNDITLDEVQGEPVSDGTEDSNGMEMVTEEAAVMQEEPQTEANQESW